MNNIILSRLINNYITNLQLNDKFVNLIKQEKFGKEKIKENIYQLIYNYHYNDFLKENHIDQLNQKLQDTFKQKLIKKYLYSFAQDEINNNLKFPVGNKVNNLSFSSQDPEYRLAPIVVCREFSEDKNSYKDHVLIGEQGQHHEHIISNHMNILPNCFDKDGKEIMACLYLYPNNIIYISEREANNYQLNDLVQVLKHECPFTINGIFYVNYPIKKIDKNNNEVYDESVKQTTRLAKKLF